MGRALVALGLALLALARVSCVFVPFVSFVPPCPADALHGSTHAFTAATVLRRSPPRTDSCPALHLHVENATRPRLPVHAPVDARHHERMLVELMSAILQTDDITLLERDAQAMGVAYLDTNFTMCLAPVLLRNSVRNIMHRYSLHMVPLEHKWTRVPGNETVDAIDAPFL